jgi:hypothetical protein
MPKLDGMANLSRPYQIALGVIALLAVVWVVALRPHSSSPSSSTTPTPSAPATPAKASTSPIYHGSAPGVQGLTRAIAKAHGAVATSEANAKQLAERSAQASRPNTSSSSTTSSSQSAPSTTTTPATAKAPAASATSAPATTHVSKSPAIKAKSGAGRTAARQALVERALNEGKVAVILFWNPKGADDVAVHTELRLLETIHHLVKPLANTPKVRREIAASGLELQKPIAVFESDANQVSTYGTITQGIQVYGTPTILIVAKGGKTTVLAGLNDAYSIEQAIDETRHS